MRFLYTGADSYLATQTDPYRSLGGNMSKSIIQTKKMNNLFDDISYLSLQNGDSETKGIVLENETSLPVQNVKLGWIYPIVKNYRINIALVALNSSNQMERIGNVKEIPYNADFTEIEENQITVGDLDAGEKIGIWITRTPITDNIEQSNNCDQLYDQFLISLGEKIVDNTVVTENENANSLELVFDN